MKPNCYDCIHRREVPGSAHSACAHPATKAVRSEPFAQLAGIMGKRGGGELMAFARAFGNGPEAPMRELNIKAVQLGVDRGWFIWPMNFDPTWLENCDGFTAKATTEQAVQS